MTTEEMLLWQDEIHWLYGFYNPVIVPVSWNHWERRWEETPRKPSRNDFFLSTGRAMRHEATGTIYVPGDQPDLAKKLADILKPFGANTDLSSLRMVSITDRVADAQFRSREPSFLDFLEERVLGSRVPVGETIHLKPTTGGIRVVRNNETLFDG